MTVKDLELLYDYGYWANKKLFEAISSLTPEEFTRPVAGSYGSIRNTLVHAMSAEWGWLGRCGGPERGPRLKAEDFPSVDSLVRAWRKIETDMRQFLSGLKDRDLFREVEFSINDWKASMPVGEMMQHAANHGVHHRGQATLMLRELGHAPGNIDMLFYFADRKNG